MRHRRGTIGSAKLYQWHKGNRETASCPTRFASQSGGLRNLHLGIGTGCRCVNGGNDKMHMSAKVGPLLLEQHDYSNLPHRKILLVAQVFAPASMFSKIAETGIRVPLRTQAPLTLPGTLSTTGHFDQSKSGIVAHCCSDSGTTI